MDREHQENNKMLLSKQQQDALSEIINIGFGRAASALSILVGQRVLLEAPKVDLYPISEMNRALDSLTGNEITSVHQVFSGKLSGDAMLLMDSKSATALVDLLSGGEGKPHDMTEQDRESLRETGNILLNAFTGSFGNLLHVHITFTVPQLQHSSLSNMLTSLMINQRQLEFALIVHVNFRVVQGNVSGYVVIVMGIQSLEALMDAMRVNGFID